MPVPDYMEPSEEVKSDINRWFDRHEDTYREVWAQLDEIQDRWNNQYTRAQRKALLKLSYLNSVFSIRTPVNIHEATFRHVMNGETLERAFSRAGQGLGTYIDIHGNIRGKIEKIRQACVDEDLWNDILDHLQDGNVDAAHHRLMDAPFLADAKAPFTLANLGFTQKMCIDANVARLFAMDKVEGISPEEYEGLCTEIKEMFPDLFERAGAAYHLQWVIFDYVRFHRVDSEGNVQMSLETAEDEESIAQHGIWFDTVLGDINRIEQVIERICRRARLLLGPSEDIEAGIKDYFDQIDIKDIRKQVRDDIRQGIASDLKEEFGEEQIDEERLREEVKQGIEEAIETADGWELEPVSI